LNKAIRHIRLVPVPDKITSKWQRSDLFACDGPVTGIHADGIWPSTTQART